MDLDHHNLLLSPAKEPPIFNSIEEECIYWKKKSQHYYQEIREARLELEDFSENSRQLEAELEETINQQEKYITDLKNKTNKLQTDNEFFSNKLINYELEITNLEKKSEQINIELEKYKIYIRELEQKNDDLERAHRIVTENVGGFEQMLNQAYEKNAMLEMEIDEKEMLQIKLQRLMDEIRDLKQELNIKSINDYCLTDVDQQIDDAGNVMVTAAATTYRPSIHTEHVQSNDVNDANAQQFQQKHLQFYERRQNSFKPSSCRPTTSPAAPTTTTAMAAVTSTTTTTSSSLSTSTSKLPTINIVAEFLRKINFDKLICPKCDKFRCICLPSTLNGNNNNNNNNNNSGINGNCRLTNSNSNNNRIATNRRITLEPEHNANEDTNNIFKRKSFFSSVAATPAAPSSSPSAHLSSASASTIGAPMQSTTPTISYAQQTAAIFKRLTHKVGIALGPLSTNAAASASSSSVTDGFDDSTDSMIPMTVKRTTNNNTNHNNNNNNNAFINSVNDYRFSSSSESLMKKAWTNPENINQ